MVESKGSRPFKASFGTQGWDAKKFTLLTLVTDVVCTLSTNGLTLSGPTLLKLSQHLLSLPSHCVCSHTRERLGCMEGKDKRFMVPFLQEGRPTNRLPCEEQYAAFAPCSHYLLWVLSGRSRRKETKAQWQRTSRERWAGGSASSPGLELLLRCWYFGGSRKVCPSTVGVARCWMTF